jgi:hypothetical protein
MSLFLGGRKDSNVIAFEDLRVNPLPVKNKFLE